MYSVVLMMALTTGADAPDCHRHSCGGGSCAGYSCGGGCHGGGGHALLGGHRHSCSGGCYGGGYCTGYYGGGCTGYYGGCTGAYGGCTGGIIYMMPEGKKPEKIEGKPKEKKDKDEDEVAAPATIMVSLPADAQLTVDGAATTSTTATRTLITPVLNPEKEFVYVLSAKIVRNGETLTVTEQVTVRAGAETRVNFGTEKFTAKTVASK
jgi:uncharacterized protein (TIGR03000 family)